MARQAVPIEVNKFNAGLITDANPLTSPDNSSLEEDNMVLNVDGSRNRRLGLDYETGFQIITTTIENAGSVKVANTTYRWDNAGGDPDKSIEVIQIGNELKFFDLDISPISNGLFHTQLFSSSLVTSRFSYTVVDGILVITTGEKEVYSLQYQSPSTITVSTNRLLIRDFFGVEDIDGGTDITRGTSVQNRPTVFTNNHTYNLRNQSWGIPRLDAGAEIVSDPIMAFRSRPGNRIPSNADTVTEVLHPDAEDTDDRTIDRFFPNDLIKNPLGTTRSPQGYYIIDALDRGTSRLLQNTQNMARYPQLTAAVTTLPQDMTPGGAKVASEFAGRVFYGGFSGEVVGGDGHSPKMSSYILFSKVVDSPADIALCYQEGDPTSKNSPDIIDTDGGFIRINEAYGVKRLISLGSSLLVIAVNGVWRITGGTDKGFTATSYIVEKITDRGCTSEDSIAVIDNSFMYWADDAIYHVNPDQFGGWKSDNISFGRIQRLYDSISTEDKRSAKGEYDSYERKVRWLYYNRTTDDTPTKEIILDLQLQAYYTNTIKKMGGNNFPRAVAMYVAKPYQIILSDIEVLAGPELVLVGTDEVIISLETKRGIFQREIGYLVITSVDPVVQYTFATYRNSDFRDWFSVDNVGVDADAYVVSSFISGNDFQREKQVPYITIHSKRTESGFEQVGNELVPLTPSSILVQVRWDWSDSTNSGKWGREFQAYRYRRLYIPVDALDDYDNGFETVVSKNKLRGTGKVLSLKFRTEPNKDFHLYGWSMIFSVAENI